jgi:outer membrane protein OmpA-like peptidoglycan-associated protein
MNAVKGSLAMKISRFFAPLVAFSFVLAIGCATPPKPRELEAFERLRADPMAAAAAKKAPALVKSADDLLKRSREQWQDKDLAESANSALMGQIKLKNAMSQAEQDRASARIRQAEDDLEDVKEEQEKVQKDLDDVNEKIALLNKLHAQAALSAEQAAERKALEEQMEAEKKAMAEKAEQEKIKAATAEKISDAELALKSADTVLAVTYAKAEYTAAADTLARAQKEMQEGSFQAAQMSADIAKKKAISAMEVAKPEYTKKAQTEENRARIEALWKDASSLPGVEARRDVRGSLQRLVLSVQSEMLFVRKQTVIDPAKQAVLVPIGEVLKRYPQFPVQVVGYTDARGNASQNLALSLARAQSVFNTLLSSGVEARRMMASGQGGADPIAGGKDRNRNNRIEIIFLYQ